MYNKTNIGKSFESKQHHCKNMQHICIADGSEMSKTELELTFTEQGD